MKVVIQRVKSAKCIVDGEIVSEIQKGLLVFTCLEIGDTQDTLEACAKKILNLRIFEDEKFRMNFNIQDVDAQILNISQFTLSWDGRKGHRPSFDKSMPPSEANLKYEVFSRLLAKVVDVKKGVFGADMQVELINDGPVTFCLEF